MCNHKDFNSNFIEPTRLFIEQHYKEDISLEHLAKMAGKTSSYLSRKFKETVGVSPIAYLYETRMKHARNYIQKAELSIKEVASKVGYEDEFYFSRKFKAYYGVSPLQYSKKVKSNNITTKSAFSISTDKKIAVTLQRLADPLVALGIEPAAIACFGCVLRDTYLYDKLPHVKDLGEYPATKEKLEAVTPDLIIADKWRSGIEYRSYSEIAPTIIISGEGWRDYLFNIAKLFGKREEANNLIKNYDHLIDISRRKLARSIFEEDVLVLRVYDEQLLIFNISQNCVSGVLYNDLGLKAPSALYKQEWNYPITLNELKLINPAHIFVEIVPWHENSNNFYDNTIQTSKEWLTLDAVRNKNIYLVDNSLWVEGDGVLGRKLMVEDIVQKMCN